MVRELIVNADDFGLSAGVNRGIIETVERGIVTSASLMVRQPAAKAAGVYARANRSFSVGLHLDFGEWVLRGEEWVPLYTVVPTDDAAEVSREIQRQLATFADLAGSPPTHLDSHQHVHRQEPVRSLVLQAGLELGVPVRDFTPQLQYCGDFYGQGTQNESYPEILTVAGLKTILQSLPQGTTELGCHPGCADDLLSPYRAERTLEVAVLCTPEIGDFLISNKIQLRAF
jgi:chitin disaccharide deacetylase